VGYPLSPRQVGADFINELLTSRFLAELKVPVLVIGGEKSNLPLDGTEEWAKIPQDARMLLIPEAGHAAFVDEPQDAVHAIRVFLNGEWPKMVRRLVDAKPSRTLRGSSPQ